MFIIIYLYDIINSCFFVNRRYTFGYFTFLFIQFFLTLISKIIYRIIGIVLYMIFVNNSPYVVFINRSFSLDFICQFNC